MATYVRQSSFSDGDTITAALFNNEFNQLVNAFDVATGHTHDGSTAGDGGPLSNLFSNALVFGTNTNNDIAITFNATSNDGVLTWMEDEDYFKFSDDILLTTTEKVQFRDTAIYINSSTDGQLDIVADTEIQIAATTIDINGNADISGNLGVGGNLTVTGTTTFNGGTITMGDAATDNVVFGADVDSNIIPDDDDTYDLGSSTQQWRNLFIDGTANIDSLVADTADINGGTIDAANITVGSGKTLNVSAGTLTLADNQISGDKVEGGTINATTINTLTYGSITDGTITVTAFVDEDNMASNSATLIPTQQSVKAYVDAQDTAQDLDLVSDSGTIAIDLDGETLTVTGGEGIDTSASSNTLTITGEDATTSNKGIASFNSDDFNVSSGAVTLATTSTAAELNLLDGTTAGTIVASKGVAVDANKDITGFRNITLTGELDAGSLDISGNADIDGTLEADAITIAGVTLAETISDTVGAMVASNTETGIAVTYDDADNTLDFVIGDNAIVQSMIADNAIDSQMYVDGSIDLVHMSANSVDSDQYVDGSIDTAHIADSQITSAKIVDGTIATGDIANDAVTGDKLANNIDIAGTLDVTGVLTADSNVVIAGNLTVQGDTTTLNTATLDVEDKNITLNKGAGDTSGSANGAGLTIQDAVDASNDATILWDTTNDEFDFSHPINVAGKVTSTGTSVFASLDISGDIDVDGTTNLDVVDIDGAVNMATTLTVAGAVATNTITVNGASSGNEGGEIVLSGAGSSETFNLDNFAGIFRIFDGSSPAVRLTLDTSGNAVFAGSVTATSLDISGDIDVDGTTNLDVVDIDGAVDMASTLTIGSTLKLEGTLGDWAVDNQGVVMTFSRASASYLRATNSSGYLIFQTGGSNTALTLNSNQTASFEGQLSAKGGLIVDGGSTVINQLGADLDFRVESDANGYMLFVDGGNNVVAVGGNVTADPWTGYYPLAVGSNLMIGSTGASSTFTNFVHAGYWNGSAWLQRYTNVTQSRQEMIGAQAGSTHNFYTSANVDVDTAVTEVKNLSLYKTGAVFNEGGVDLDFRVESDNNPNALFIAGLGAATNNLAVGIGTQTISNPYSQTNFTDLNIDGVWGGVISFKLGGTEKGWIGQRNSGNGGMALGSSSGNSLYLNSGGNNSRMEFTSAGHVVVNPTGTTTDFTVSSDSNTNMLFVDGGSNFVGIGDNTNTGYTLNVAGAAQVRSSFVVTSGGGANLTQGDIMIKSSTSDSPSARGQGVFLFNEGVDQTWYAGTGYNAAAHYHIGFAAGTSASKEGARVTAGVFHLYNNASGAVFNENGTDRDFRVESDTNANLLFVDAGSEQVKIGASSVATYGKLEVQNADGRHGVGQKSWSSVAGTGHPCRSVDGVMAFNTASAGTQLSIPIVSQANQHRPALVELTFLSGEYNTSGSVKAGFVRFAFQSLNSIGSVAEIDKSGNVASVASSGMNILINFTSAYTAGQSNYEGVMCYYRVIHEQPQYVKMWDATLN